MHKASGARDARRSAATPTDPVAGAPADGRWLAAAAPALALSGSRFLAWLVETILATVAVDALLRLLERGPCAGRVLATGYARKYRRYPDPAADAATHPPGPSAGPHRIPVASGRAHCLP